MGTVHHLLEAHGKQHVLDIGAFERRIVEAAHDYMSDEETGVGFIYSGLCQAALPHKRLPDDVAWKIETPRVMLLVEPGQRPVRGQQKTVKIGVPYGSKARLIVLYLTARAVETRCREIELGSSMREWLRRMGIPQGGKSMSDVRDQAERISSCRMSFHFDGPNRHGFVNQNLVDHALSGEALFLDADTPGQGELFMDRIRLSEGFYEQLTRHPVPLEESAIRRLNGHSMALDLYCWLAYRLHAVRDTSTISWRGLKGQFGTGFRRMDHFRDSFRTNLELAKAVYPDAKVDIDERGVTLKKSRPPVAPRLITMGPGRVPTPMHAPGAIRESPR